MYNRPHPGHYHGRSHTRDDGRYVHHTHTAIHTRLLGRWFSFIGGSSPCRERERRNGEEAGEQGEGGGKGGGGMGSEGIVTHKLEGTQYARHNKLPTTCVKCFYIYTYMFIVYTRLNFNSMGLEH